MSKISPVSIKYIVRASFSAEGTVEKPDVIGAVFGQTEGLLGEDLELRELQKEGKIGRIEVTLKAEKGQTNGEIEIPTSLDKTETALIAAALETIERVGPSESKIKVDTIEDVRGSKRDYVMERAKKLLQRFNEDGMETSELKTTIVDNVRMNEIVEYGVERLPAGPEINESKEAVIVEGRADVLNLLKCGIKNAVALNGTALPESIIKLCEDKSATLFVDGDRGGDLITKNVTTNCKIAYLARAPDGKEVEELTKKEVLKALRDKISSGSKRTKDTTERVRSVTRTPTRTYNRKPKEPVISPEDESALYKMQEEITGTRGAYLLDSNMEMLGKVPLSELATTLKGIKAYALIADGSITSEITYAAEYAGVEIILAKEFSKKGNFKALTFKSLAKI